MFIGSSKRSIFLKIPVGMLLYPNLKLAQAGRNREQCMFQPLR